MFRNMEHLITGESKSKIICRYKIRRKRNSYVDIERGDVVYEYVYVEETIDNETEMDNKNSLVVQNL